MSLLNRNLWLSQHLTFLAARNLFIYIGAFCFVCCRVLKAITHNNAAGYTKKNCNNHQETSFRSRTAPKEKKVKVILCSCGVKFDLRKTSRCKLNLISFGVQSETKERNVVLSVGRYVGVCAIVREIGGHEGSLSCFNAFLSNF